MIFNLDLSKQAQEVIFSRKTNKVSHPTTAFNTVPVARTSCQKHLVLHLDEKLNFSQHINTKISKANKGIGIIKRLSHIRPRKSLLTIYKSFIRAHLNVIYDQPNNESFCIKIERILYNADLAITGAIRGTSQIKLHKELVPESLTFRRWFRRLCTFFKIKIHGKPKYLLNKIPSSQTHYNTRNTDQFETCYCRTDIFKNSFFLYTIEWNKHHLDVLKSKSYVIFRNALLKLGRPHQNAIYSINNPVGLKLLTRLRLGCSRLNKHRFNHKFQNCINPLCSCSLETESTSHFLLHYHHYTNIHLTLLNNIAKIIGNIFNITNECWSTYYSLAVQNTLK